MHSVLVVTLAFAGIVCARPPPVDFYAYKDCVIGDTIEDDALCNYVLAPQVLANSERYPVLACCTEMAPQNTLDKQQCRQLTDASERCGVLLTVNSETSAWCCSALPVRGRFATAFL